MFVSSQLRHCFNTAVLVTNGSRLAARTAIIGLYFGHHVTMADHTVEPSCLHVNTCCFL